MVIKLGGIEDSGEIVCWNSSSATGGPTFGTSRQAEIMWLRTFVGGYVALAVPPLALSKDIALH
jgi:hypothetical protein